MHITKSNKVTFCIVDDIESYANDEIKTTIKNISDFTISNLYTKGYKVLVGKNEDELLQQVTTDHAVIMSPGTEYINGSSFFQALEELMKKDFFIAGHVLDRTSYDAYYELHHQCYVINMKYYRSLGSPFVGSLEKNVSHTQIEPARSIETWHDDYTPKFVSAGTRKRKYNNQCHGWNILRLAIEHQLPVLIFDYDIRKNKKHYYPESEKDYYENAGYIDHKFNYCKDEFVHVGNIELSKDITERFEQVVIPASGTHYLDLIETGLVIFYDYNICALDYWKEHCLRKENIDYLFVHTNLLEECSIVDHLDPNLKTLINLSNIFCYEGTAAKYSLEYRMRAEENLITMLKKTIKNIHINISASANIGHQ
jgi:hypothetical protein